FHFVLPPLFPYLMQEFGLSFTQVGALMTTFFVVSGVGQALAGFVVDRVGSLKVLCGGIALLGASGLVLASAPNYAMLFVGAAVAFGGLQNFAPPVFERPYGVTLAFATTGLTAYLLGNAAGTATGGFFASQGVHQDRLVAIALGSAALCAISLASGALPSWSLVAVMGAMGFGAGFSGP